ncbi:MAG: prolipoprotein diacylglyceryl transferase [Cytophagaceae bacterium]|jgi:prolipoprotein diacylglyceryltransferase|nr:prolipoprotein diacylglyceryl transferase [Cytophagaceae bacterium]
MLSFLVWSIDPEIITIASRSLRYYGILFFLGFLVGYEILVRIFKIEGKDPRDVDTLTVYMLVATILGARLGHCLFYEPDYFLKHPIEIIYVWNGGLASHGAAAGILLALFLYSRKKVDQSYLYILDRIVITIAFAAFCIRMGNFMNSEIVGKPTNGGTGVVFAYQAKMNVYNYIGKNKLVGGGVERISDVDDITVKNTGKDTVVGNQRYALVEFYITSKAKGNPEEFLTRYRTEGTLALQEKDEEVDHILPTEQSSVTTNSKGQAVVKAVVMGIPRHPSQIYEAISSLVLFGLLLWVYSIYKAKTPEGLIFALFVIWIFGLRFVYEFLKENQVRFEDSMPLNMGQILSIPLVLAGILVLVQLARKGKLRLPEKTN